MKRAQLLVGLALTAPITMLATSPVLAGPVIVYARDGAAVAIHDGGARVAGVRDAYRQAPAVEDPRYPAGRRVGKVAGRDLAARDAAGMAALLRSQLHQRDIGDRVAVDEIEAPRFPPDRLAELSNAIGRLGGEAQGLVWYVAPGTVQQVGRADRRYPLSAPLQTLVSTLAQAGDTYLVLYHGDGGPFTRDEMAVALTGWVARWPADRLGRLHVMTGPERGAGQAEIWGRVRATPAGRTLLGSGPGVWGLGSASEGLHWLAQYRTFLAAPNALPPGGEARIPTGGGLAFGRVGRVLRPGARVTLTIGRPGSVAVILTRQGGRQRRIAGFTGPATRVVRLPADVLAGAYTLRAVQFGDGLKDVATVSFRVRRG